jgi:hypothetical protein
MLDRVPHSPRDLVAGQTCLAFTRTWTNFSDRDARLRCAVDLLLAQHPIRSFG